MMKVIQYFPDSKGTRFLKQFQKSMATIYDDDYEFFNKSGDLFKSLENRINSTDLILITAHGTPEYIEGELEKGEPIKINMGEFHRFRNSFVFAFSCSTADLGEVICEESDVLSYLGFNDIVNLKVKTSQGKYEKEFSNILRQIYNDTLIESFTTFTQQNYTVSQLANLISLNLKRCYVKLLAMKPEEIVKKYLISKRVANNKEFIKCLHADLLTTIDAVRERITIYGERDFIPWYFIKSEDQDILVNLLEKVHKTEYLEKNIYYKSFLLGYLYRKLNIKDSSDHHLKNASENYPEYEPISILQGKVN